MCGYNCTRSFLFVLSLFFTLVGGALMGTGIYALIHQLIYDKHFLDSHFEKAATAGSGGGGDGGGGGGFSEEEKERFIFLFLVVTSVCVGLGFAIFAAGIAGVVGACRNFSKTDRYGERVGYFCQIEYKTYGFVEN